jgi:hypothetical protein
MAHVRTGNLSFRIRAPPSAAHTTCKENSSNALADEVSMNAIESIALQPAMKQAPSTASEPPSLSCSRVGRKPPRYQLVPNHIATVEKVYFQKMTTAADSVSRASTTRRLSGDNQVVARLQMRTHFRRGDTMLD